MSELSLAHLEPLMAGMREHAMAWYPRECCGLVVETDGRLSAIHCENLQDKLHALDPASYPRTAETAYSLDPRVFMRVEEQGGSVRAIFHSHPDRGAYFSDEDVLMALGGEAAGDPALPGVDYLVLSARAAGVDDAKLFAWDSETRSFKER